MNTTFLIILIGLILMGLWGWFSGFIKMVCVLCSSIICLVLTLFLTPITTDILTRSDKVYNFFYEKVASNIEIPAADLQNSLATLDMADFPEELLGNTVVDGLRELVGEMDASTIDPGEFIRDKVTLMIIKVVAFIVTYIIVSVLVGLMIKIFNVLSKLPVINVANKALGVVSGVALCLLLVLVFMAVVDYVTPSLCEGLIEDINSNAILKWMSEHNFISPIINNFLKD